MPICTSTSCLLGYMYPCASYPHLSFILFLSDPSTETYLLIACLIRILNITSTNVVERYWLFGSCTSSVARFFPSLFPLSPPPFLFLIRDIINIELNVVLTGVEYDRSRVWEFDDDDDDNVDSSGAMLERLEDRDWLWVAVCSQ